MAFVTRRVLLSLGLAICLGGLLLHLPGNPTSSDAWGSGLYAAGGFLKAAVMYEVTLFSQSAETMGIADSGYSIFLDVIQYRFYCLFILALVFLHIILGRDFGPMKAAEERALKEELDVQTDERPTAKGHALWVALIPLSGLLLFHFVGIWYDGGGLQKLHEGVPPTNWAYWREVIGSSENTILIFDFAALFGLCLAILCARFLVQFPFDRTMACLWQGIVKSVVPCLILTFAWSLKNCSDALHADDFLVALLTENVSLVFLPCLVFLVACLTSFTTGTSWGTMAILIPIVGPVAFQLEQGTYGLITMISLGAVLEGAFLAWYSVQFYLPEQFKIYLLGNVAPDWGGPSTSNLCLALEECDDGCRLKVSDAHHGRVSDQYVDSLKSGWGRLFGEGLRDYVERNASA